MIRRINSTFVYADVSICADEILICVSGEFEPNFDPDGGMHGMTLIDWAIEQIGDQYPTTKEQAVALIDRLSDADREAIKEALYDKLYSEHSDSITRAEIRSWPNYGALHRQGWL